MGFDFSGWATRNDLLCADGKTIRKNAFKDNDNTEVPLIWNHDHSTPDAVLGHALLRNKDDGVYAYCTFNDSAQGKKARELVHNGDVRCLSIYANGIKHIGGDVVHGVIRELSLVLAGANPGAYIDYVMAHGDDGDDGIYASWDESGLMLYHSEEKAKEEKTEETKTTEEEPKMADKTVKDIFDTFTEEQKNVVYAMIAAALDENTNKEDENMKHNVFDNDSAVNEDVLMHTAMQAVVDDAKRYGSMKESFLAHSQEYGIEQIDYLFPEAKETNVPPSFIQRDMSWVNEVMNSVTKSPFSRIRTSFADITEDAARAKGYIKGKLKKEEVFSLLKRSTRPTTIYKKQKMDRDDIIDITDFNVVPWIKSEMRLMLDEEIARAILTGDGRLTSDDDHIDTDAIRPIIDDADLFVIRWAVAEGQSGAESAENLMDAAVRARKNYKGSGRPVMFTTEDWVTEMLLMKDGIGHRLHKTESELATALRVEKIVTSPIMEGVTDKDGKKVYAIIVNLKDYKVGADKGGSINMFEDFDIDYNQEKYLIETRCSGALVVPFSAIVLREGEETKSEEPTLQEAMRPYKVKQQG